jgi:hypothetical protein
MEWVEKSKDGSISRDGLRLPGENASTRVLRGVGFVLVGPAIHEEDGQILVWRHEGGTPVPGAPF